MDTAPDQRFPEVRLDQPRASGRVAVPPEHQRDPAADEPAHVPADHQRPGRGDAAAVQVSPRKPVFAALCAVDTPSPLGTEDGIYNAILSAAVVQWIERAPPKR